MKRKIFENYADKHNFAYSETQIPLQVKWPTEIDNYYLSTHGLVNLNGFQLNNGFNFIVLSAKEAYETLQKCASFQFEAEVEQMGETMRTVLENTRSVKDRYIEKRLEVVSSTADSLIFRKLPEYLFVDMREEVITEDDSFCIYAVVKQSYR